MDYYKIPAGFLRYHIDPGEIGSWPLLAMYARVASEGCCGESEGEGTHTLRVQGCLLGLISVVLRELLASELPIQCHIFPAKAFPPLGP